MTQENAETLQKMAQSGMNVGLFSDVASAMSRQFPHAPSTFGDGVRTIAYRDIPFDAIAEVPVVGEAIVNVRIPLAHHKKLHQGWVSGAWSL